MELQEVQKQENRYKTPNDIEGIGYVERKLSYKKQIRDKEEGSSGGAAIVEISNYTSADEWQPVVDRVFAGESITVRCKFTEYSNLITYYFIPMFSTSTQIKFGCSVVGMHRFRITCWLSGTTITSIGTNHGSWNTEN